MLVCVVRLGTSLPGPPESMREHVVAAAHAMGKGNWKACCDYITTIKVCLLLSCHMINVSSHMINVPY